MDRPLTLPRFDRGKQMTCPACGLTGAHRPRYCEGRPSQAPYTGCGCVRTNVEGPHLDIACAECGYVWAMGLTEPEKVK
jgi:hypothetical protein